MKRYVARLFLAAGLVLTCAPARPALARAPSDAEAQSIVTLCGGGLNTSVRAGLVAKLQGWAKSLQGSAEIGAEAGKRTLGALFGDLPSGQQIDPGLYKAFLDCVLKATDNILKEASVNSLNQLQIVAEMFDLQPPAHTDPVHHTFSKTYSRGKEPSVGREIAVEMIEHLRLVPHSTALNVTLINEGGKLRLQQPGGLASLHVSRFLNVMTLADLAKQPLSSIEKFMNAPLLQIYLRQEDIDDGNFDWVTRAGVYRIAVAAPFYREQVIYSELSGRGDLYVPLSGWVGFWEAPPSGSLKFQPLALPLRLTLMRSSDNLRIAGNIDVAAPNFPGASFPTEARNLEQGFAEAVREHSGYEFVARGSAVYDPSSRKGLPSTREPADVEVDVHAILLPVN